MASCKPYTWQSNHQCHKSPDLNAPLPPLPPSSSTVVGNHKQAYETPITPFDDQVYRLDNDRSLQPSRYGTFAQVQDPFTDDAAIPLQTHHPVCEVDHYGLNHATYHGRHNAAFSEGGTLRQMPRSRIGRSCSQGKIPWITYTLTIVQIIVFVVELIRNAVLTGSPIEIHPSFNPMIGPSPYVLINSGGRYVPCMRAQSGVQDSNTTISWPCPNQIDSSPSCSLSQLCGFNGVPNPQIGGSLSAKPAPHQWFRFIIPIFLHAGVVHIGFNMLLQMFLGRDIENAIGHIRFVVVYFSSGIFGFLMSGNFAPSGIVSTGASGSLFGIIALVLLDLFYTWSTRIAPLRELFYILLDITISFVLGLLPGLDNFSHIGGFLMGLILGVCLLRSPSGLKQRRQREKDQAILRQESRDEDDLVHEHTVVNTSLKRPMVSIAESTQRPLPPLPLESKLADDENHITAPWYRGTRYISFLVLRIVMLVTGITCTVLLLQAFYRNHNTECTWCKYLSCLPVRNWCDVGDLVFQTQGVKGTS